MLLAALLLALGPPLRAPAALQARATSPYSLALTWKAPPDALAVELSARIRAARGKPWTRLALLPANPGAFSAHALPPSTAFELRARSWNGRAPSDWSKVFTARTPAFVDPPLAASAECVPREQLLAAAIGDADPACAAKRLQLRELSAGALHLLLVDPLAPGCHTDQGQIDAAFAEIGGCLRPLGPLIDLTQAVPLQGAKVPPLRSYWHTRPGAGEVSIIELRNGTLQVVDSGPVDADAAFAALPSTTDKVLVDQLQGAAGAAVLKTP